MSGTLNPLEIACAIAGELEARGVAYAVGGALAYGFWGPPRGTIDVDLDVFEDSVGVERAFAALRATGAVFDDVQARASVLDRGDFRAHVGAVRVDVFVGFDPYHDVVRDRRVRREILGRSIWILAAEDLTVFKVLFDRPKDWVDLERLVALRASELDWAYVERWLGHWLGATDSRLERLSALRSRFGR